MGDYVKESFHIEGLMSTIVRLKNINNNGQDASCCELNGCQAMKPCDGQRETRTFGKDYHDMQEVLNENGTIAKQEMATDRFQDEDDAPPHSNESSSSNSTGNLSISQYDYADDDEDDNDDVIFLANQQFADDDVSEQSDDCVYAYRGADFDALEYRNNNNIDDETDFLEMDFEPDPASEIDNATNECHNGCRSCNPDPTADELLLPIQLVDETSTPNPGRPNFNANNASQKTATSVDEWRNIARNQNNISSDEGGEDLAVANNFKMTGAKPKKQLAEKSGAPSPRKQLQLEAKARDEMMAIGPIYRNGGGGTLSDPDEPCIDCLEKEFLSSTVGRKIDATYCKRCRRKAVNGYYEKGAEEMNGFASDLAFEHALVVQKPSVMEPTYLNVENFAPSQNGDYLLLKRTGKDSVTFSSVNIDEKVIIQALDHINVSFNKDMIKRHFEERSNFQPHLDNVTELILYTSKRNCDYKKIIKLIKLACNDDVDIKFTRDENVSKETEIVQVRSCDILEKWTIQQHNLERLKRLNKKFIQMNVLGKVINLIRHAQQRTTKSIEDEFIIVPQYYKTGYICITKK